MMRCIGATSTSGTRSTGVACCLLVIMLSVDKTVSVLDLNRDTARVISTMGLGQLREQIGDAFPNAARNQSNASLSVHRQLPGAPVTLNGADASPVLAIPSMQLSIVRGSDAAIMNQNERQTVTLRGLDAKLLLSLHQLPNVARIGWLLTRDAQPQNAKDALLARLDRASDWILPTPEGS